MGEWTPPPHTSFIIYKLVLHHLQTFPSSSTDLSFVIYRLVFHHLQTYPSSSTDFSFVVYNLVLRRLQSCPSSFTKCATNPDHEVFRLCLGLYVFSDTLQIPFFFFNWKNYFKNKKKIIFSFIGRMTLLLPSSSTNLSFIMSRLVPRHLQTCLKRALDGQ